MAAVAVPVSLADDVKVALSPAREKVKRTAIVLAAAALFATAAHQLDLDVAQFLERLANITEVLPRFMAFDVGVLGQVAPSRIW